MRIYMDTRAVLDGLCDWLRVWKENNWKTGDKESMWEDILG